MGPGIICIHAVSTGWHHDPMKRLLLLCLLLGTPALAETIRGTVVDDGGLPLPGATIALGQQRATSGPDGRFVIAVDLAEPASVSYTHLRAHET